MGRAKAPKKKRKTRGRPSNKSKTQAPRIVALKVNRKIKLEGMSKSEWEKIKTQFINAKGRSRTKEECGLLMQFLAYLSHKQKLTTQDAITELVEACGGHASTYKKIFDAYKKNGSPLPRRTPNADLQG